MYPPDPTPPTQAVSVPSPIGLSLLDQPRNRRGRTQPSLAKRPPPTRLHPPAWSAAPSRSSLRGRAGARAPHLRRLCRPVRRRVPCLRRKSSSLLPTSPSSCIGSNASPHCPGASIETRCRRSAPSAGCHANSKGHGHALHLASARVAGLVLEYGGDEDNRVGRSRPRQLDASRA